jgi:penicillin-binding protein 1C
MRPVRRRPAARRAATALLLAAGLGSASLWGLDRWIAATDLPPLIVETSTEVRDRDGVLLRAYTVEDGRWRLATNPASVDPGYLDMLIAYEDRRFYRHPGVDWRALLRAGAQALRHGRVVSGGSTLTMQVARLLEGSGTGRWPGKLRQIRVALALERRLDKEAILGLYLHLAPYGGNIEGLRAAALTWFGVEPDRLRADQAALLVALPQAPESRRPDRHPEAAQRARDRVLDRAVRFSGLTEDAVAWARAMPVPQARRPFPALAPHLADRALAERPAQRIHRLTLDAEVQARMETLARRAVQGHDPQLGAAIMVLDHATGAVLASVGATDFTDAARRGFVDMTRAVRSPGSTLKPLIFGLAFDRGLIHPQTLIDDRPTRFGSYAPQNFDGVFRGELTVAAALQVSLNIPAVALLEAVGPAELLAAMRRAGVAYALPPGGESAGLAIALGGIGTRLEDLMRLYGAIARGGTAVPWHWRLDAALPSDPSAQGRQVIGPLAAWYLGDILGDVPPPATAPRTRLAFKTGTSYGHRDAWAFGFDGRHVVGVWLGRPDGSAVPGAFGADLAAPILFEAFARLGTPVVPRAGPPTGALILSNRALPTPLRHFGRAAEGPEAGPEIVFPPDGAEVALSSDLPLIARVAAGQPPYTWLWNGAPVATRSFDAELSLDLRQPGFGALTVIDAAGQAARVAVELTTP